MQMGAGNGALLLYSARIVFEQGSVVALREIFRGRVWRALASIVVRVETELMVFWTPHGSEIQVAVSEQGYALVNQPAQWRLQHRRWSNPGALRFAVPGEPYSIWPMGELGSGDGWYVNLEDPLRPSPLGYDSLDHKLDLLLFPDGTWLWKDEDHLEEAVSKGNFSLEEAAAMRATGERVLARFRDGWRPFNEWRGWRPDPSWSAPDLPAGWNDPLREGRPGLRRPALLRLDQPTGRIDPKGHAVERREMWRVSRPSEGWM